MRSPTVGRARETSKSYQETEPNGLSSQCDRIGGIFDPGAIFYFEQIFTKKRSTLFGSVFPRLELRIDFDRNGLGHTLGDIFTNSPGRPVSSLPWRLRQNYFIEFRSFGDLHLKAS
jgi:hypothetical protein